MRSVLFSPLPLAGEGGRRPGEGAFCCCGRDARAPRTVILRGAKRVILREVAGRRIQKKLTAKNAKSAKKKSASLRGAKATKQSRKTASREGAKKKSPLSKADCSRSIDFILFVMKEQQQGIV
jgi:hypothetical protein